MWNIHTTRLSKQYNSPKTVIFKEKWAVSGWTRARDIMRSRQIFYQLSYQSHIQSNTTQGKVSQPDQLRLVWNVYIYMYSAICFVSGSLVAPVDWVRSLPVVCLVCRARCYQSYTPLPQETQWLSVWGTCGPGFKSQQNPGCICVSIIRLIYMCMYWQCMNSVIESSCSFPCAKIHIPLIQLSAYYKILTYSCLWWIKSILCLINHTWKCVQGEGHKV